MSDSPADPQLELEKIRLSKSLEAEAALRGHERDLAKLARTHEYEVATALRTHEYDLATLAAAHEYSEATASAAATREKERLDKVHLHEATQAVDAAAGELTKLKQQSAVDLRKAQWDAEHALHKAYHDNVAEVAKGAIERSRKGAEFVEKAALAIVGIYTGLLGLVFSVTDRPLPRRGVYPALFFGLAIAAAAAYLAFLRRADKVPGRKPGSTLRETQENRTFFLSDWITAVIFNKRYAMRVSVLALMVGVAFLPAPFVAEPEATANAAAVGAVDPPVPDEDIEDQAQRAARFEADLRIYENAARAAIRAGTLRSSEELESAAEGGESLWLWALIGGLAFCLTAPLLYGWIRRNQ